jgi:hypothetical protein
MKFNSHVGAIFDACGCNNTSEFERLWPKDTSRIGIIAGQSMRMPSTLAAIQAFAFQTVENFNNGLINHKQVKQFQDDLLKWTLALYPQLAGYADSLVHESNREMR